MKKELHSRPARGARLSSPFNTNAPFSVTFDLRRLLRVRKEALALCRRVRRGQVATCPYKTTLPLADCTTTTPPLGPVEKSLDAGKPPSFRRKPESILTFHQAERLRLRCRATPERGTRAEGMTARGRFHRRMKMDSGFRRNDERNRTAFCRGGSPWPPVSDTPIPVVALCRDRHGGLSLQTIYWQ